MLASTRGPRGPILCGVSRAWTFAAVLAFALLCLPAAPVAQPAATFPTDAAMEEFLLTAPIIRTRGAGQGVTGSTRATLRLGELTHDAHIQTIEQSRSEFRTRKGIEFNFRDSWQFNVAAYKVDRLLSLNLVPVTVERTWKGKGASFTWWADDVMMDEGQRIQQKVEPPDRPCWSAQMQRLRVFDQLIANSDRNLGNMVITKTWRLWAIDHTRAFRAAKRPPEPANLTRIERRVLERLAALEFNTLKPVLRRYLSDADLRALLSRRDAIVAHFTERGERALYDGEETLAACGR